MHIENGKISPVVILNYSDKQQHDRPGETVMLMGVCWDHSHSMVPVGLGVKSNSTLLIPSTSAVILAVILCSTG